MKKQTLLLPAGKEFVKFIEIAKLVADAMHPGHDDDDLKALATAAATRSLKDELDRAAIHGVLPLKDPQTLAPCPIPLPMALVSVDDLLAYFKGRLTIAIDAVPSEAEAAPAQTMQSEPSKPVQRSAAQEQAILAEIERLNLDRRALPKPEPGKAGVKATVRASLEGLNPLFLKRSRVFEKAWERLRQRGEIADK
jgi:hypothetical protein